MNAFGVIAQMGELPPPPQLAAIAIVIFLAIGIHEFAHAKFADMAGDPTPRYFGRVTLNLTKHFELIGTIMIIFTSIAGIGIGWGKPVPMDPSKMRNPRWDHFIAVIAGPLSNLLQATFFAMMFRFLVIPALQSGAIAPGGFFTHFVFLGVAINISLFVFNLLPIGPLDGMWLFGTFLNERSRVAWTRWNLTTGQFVFLALILLGQLSEVRLLSAIMAPPMDALLRLLLGPIA